MRLGVAMAELEVGVGVGAAVGVDAAGVVAATGLVAGWLESAELESARLDAAPGAASWLAVAPAIAVLAGAGELLPACGCPLVQPATRSRQASVAIDAHRLGVIWSG